MTATTLARPADPVVAYRRVLWPADAAVAALLLWWSTSFVWGSGGQDRHVLSVACALLAVAACLVQPWRALPFGATFLAGSVCFAAFAVPLTAPTGWAGANDAASFTFAALLLLVLCGWAQDSVRRGALLGLLVVAALFEFAQGFVAWWASGSPDKIFVGTFYWHNQVGIYLAVGAVLALAALLGQVARLGALAWVAFPLCVAGVSYSTSRGSQIALALGVCCVGGLALHARGSWQRVGLRLPLALGAAWLVTKVLAGPPLFEVARSGATDAFRAQSIGENAGHRLEFWHQAWNNFLHWPLSGAGFHSFAAATRVTTERRSATSAFAHNGYLQLLSDGGLLLAVPVCGGLVVLLVQGARRNWATRGTEPARGVALIATVMLLLHSGMDFDWSYPALLSAVAVTGAAMTAPDRTSSGQNGLLGHRTSIVWRPRFLVSLFSPRLCPGMAASR